MGTNVIKIKCPCCGTMLAVKQQPGIENKNVTCPVCKETSPFKFYKPMTAKKSEDTIYPDNEEHTHYEETDLGVGMNFTLGQLKIMSSPLSPFRLNVGRNVIGRKASASSADIQLPTTESKRMSREHLIIEVKKMSGKGLVHYVSLYKQKVNDTFINHERLEFGDCIILKDGDMIKLPDMTVKFEIPDEESTII